MRQGPLVARPLRYLLRSLEEKIVKHVLLVGALVVGLSNVAAAQGMEIHNRLGPSGTHFPMPADTQSFGYEATVCGGIGAYSVMLDVYHNGILKSSSIQIVLLPPPSYQYYSHVDMTCWGLKPGDLVTFRCRVVGLAFGKILASHTLHGDVIPPGPPLP